MATITAFIRTTKKNSAKVKIRFRVRDGERMQLFHSSEIMIDPAVWDSTKQVVKARAVIDPETRNDIDTKIIARKSLLREIYEAAPNKESLSSEWLEAEIDKRLHPDKYRSPQQDFFDSFREFVDKRKLSDWRIKSFNVVIRALKRYEIYTRRDKPDFVMTLDNMSPLMLGDIDNFLRIEHSFYTKCPKIYEAVPECRKPLPRGQNTINGIMVKIRTFYIWANKMGLTANNPFGNFEIEENVYGTPYYISIDERDRLYHTNLSRHPRLAVQRDVFVFQCLIGCRVGDYMKMTKRNVINGAVEYIASKTKDGRPVTVRVPLSDTAKEILERYKDCGDKLMPFILPQDYNDDIKLIFLAARLQRPVMVLDPLTREPVIRPLNEIASSHLARRSFVGNLYKKVKDPNLVGALSGHKEGSKAFARYRDIDEEMKADLVKLLEK